MPSPTSPSPEWPGKRLGLPESGPRSIARSGRRLAAIALDWAIAYFGAFAFFDADWAAMLVIFAVLQIVFISTAGGSVGHLVFGMRLVPLVPKWIGVFRPALRTALLCLLIPAVIWDADQRGLHDKIAGTVLVRR